MRSHFSFFSFFWLPELLVALLAKKATAITMRPTRRDDDDSKTPNLFDVAYVAYGT